MGEISSISSVVDWGILRILYDQNMVFSVETGLNNINR